MLENVQVRSRWFSPLYILSPIAGWFIVENLIEMDDDWGYPHDSGNHQMVYFMENPQQKWMMTGGTHIFGNLHSTRSNGASMFQG